MGTIGAARTQDVAMRDKFKLNVMIAVPAMLLTLALLFVFGDSATEPVITDYQLLLVLA